MTAEVAILEPQEQERIGRVIDATADLILDAEAIQVHDDDTAEAATDFLSLLAGEKKQQTAARRFLVDPLNAHVKAINDRFREPAAILERADSIVREKVIAYRTERERQRQVEIARLEQEERARVAAELEERECREAHDRELAQRAAAAAELASGTSAAQAAIEFAEATAAIERERAAAPAPVEVPVRAPEPARALGSAASRKRWVATVTDEALVPRRYLVVDQRLINADVKAGTREIPGVRIEEVAELAVRAS